MQPCFYCLAADQMSLQDILDKIRASGDAQIQEIEKNTQSQVNAILAQAQTEACQIEEDSCASTSAAAYLERARILHHARLESLRTLGDVREDLVDTALSRVRDHLALIRSDPIYPSVFRMLITEALTKLTSGRTEMVRLFADQRDRKLCEEILDDMNLNIRLSYELDCWGGVIAKSQDERVVVINTLESRLELATFYLRSYLAAFFEEEQLNIDPQNAFETFKV